MESEKSKENESKESKKRINEDIETFKAGIKIDDLLKSGQSVLEGVTKMKTVDKTKLAAHSQIATGMKRKSLLEEEFDYFNAELQKLN